MAKNSTSRIKPFALFQLLQEETGPNQRLAMSDIIQKLKDQGIQAERKSIYADIDLLNEVYKGKGYHVEKYPGTPMTYALIRDTFSFNELALMVDAIQSCRAITEAQSNQLIKSIKTLANKTEQQALNRTVHVVGRIKSKNKEVFTTLDTIHEAMRRPKRKIAFDYYKLDWKGERLQTHEGQPYEVTPVSITYDDGFYYLTSWSDDDNGLREFRLDRMDAVRVSEDKAAKNDVITNYAFDEQDYATFGRFGGKKKAVKLLVDKDKTEIIRDRFEEDLTFYNFDDNTASVRVRLHVSEQFFGWIASMGNIVRIAPDQQVFNEYQDYLKMLMKNNAPTKARPATKTKPASKNTASKAPAKSASKAAAKTVATSSKKPAAKTTAKAVKKPATKAAAKSVKKPTAKSMAKSSKKPAAKSVKKPAAKTTAKSATKSSRKK